MFPQHLILLEINLCPFICPCICSLRLNVLLCYANMNITQIQVISLPLIYVSKFLFPLIYFNISHVVCDLQVSQPKLCVQCFCLCYMTYLILLDFIILIIFCEEYKSWSHSFCNFFPALCFFLSGWNISISLCFQTTSTHIFPVE